MTRLPAGKVAQVVTTCSSPEDVAKALCAFASEEALALPAAEGVAAGASIRFTVALADGKPVMRGWGDVVELVPGSPGGFGLVRIKLTDMAEESRAFFGRMLELKKARPRRPSTLPPPLPGAPGRTLPRPPPPLMREDDPARFSQFVARVNMDDEPPLGGELPGDASASPTKRLPAPPPDPSEDQTVVAPVADVPPEARPPRAARLSSSEDLPTLAPPSLVAGRATGKTKRTLSARKPLLPPWAQALAEKARGAGVALLARLPETARPTVARFGPWVACGVLGFVVGYAVRGPGEPAAPVPAAVVAAAAAPAPAPVAPTPSAAVAPSPAAEAPADFARCRATVKSTPEGAAVIWGESSIGQTPVVDAEVPCGRAFVTVRHPRYEEVVRTLTARTGETVNLVERLRRPEATIDVRSKPAGARVFVNDEEAGKTPSSLQVARYESVKVRLVLDGHQPWTKQLYVKDGAAKLEAKLKKRR